MRIEHVLTDHHIRKQLFDADPLHRERSGVRGYRIQQAPGPSQFVAIDLPCRLAGRDPGGLHGQGRALGPPE
nr:hypothetical protein [Streptomyces sp. TLI_235]